MAGRSQIEWTDVTWNPVTGCTKVSAGCDHCYAHAIAHTRLAESYKRKLPVIRDPEHEADPFAVRLWPDRLNQPEKWAAPSMIFVNSMSDLFHVDVPVGYIRDIFQVMLRVDHHIYQVLTKRPGRAARFVEQNIDLFPTGRVPEHIWMGTSVENQDVHYRVEQLCDLAAEVRFLSCEPLLGPLNLRLEGILWVIVGGESGAEFRPMQPEWAISIREQCFAAGVPFFFKQWGGRKPKSGGRLLEGAEWNQMPSIHDADQLELV
jgi:protein gp37